MEPGGFRHVFDRFVDRPHDRAGSHRRGGHGIDFAAVLLQIYGIGFSRELIVEGGLLRLCAEAGGFAEVGSADAYARDLSVGVGADRDFYLAPEALDRGDADVPDIPAFCFTDVKRVQGSGFSLLKRLRVGQQRFARGFGFLRGTPGNGILCHLIGAAEAHGGD